MITVTGLEAAVMGMSSAEKVAAFRARKRAKGMCVVCGQVKPRRRKATCAECNNSAKERVKASRGARTSAPA